MKEDLKIGFVSAPFPVVEGSVYGTQEFRVKLGSSYYYVSVSRCKLELGAGFKPFNGIITHGTSGKFDGFGSWGHYDEARLQIKAVEMYAEVNNLQLGPVYNNWPTYRGYATEKTKQP